MRATTFKWIALAVFATAALLFLDWVPDDAWISFRYAGNIAAGEGPVFNPGERVEGYSNPLWTLVLAGAGMAGADLPLFGVWLGFLCALGLVWLALTLFERIAPEPREWTLRLGAAVFLAASLPMLFWATSGMETMASALALLAGALLHLRAVGSDRPRLHVAPCILFLAAAFLRPEGVAFLAFNTLVLFVQYRARLPRSVILTLAGVWILFAAVTAWRFGYYGSIVPNTAVAKPHAQPAYHEPLLRSVRYFSRFFMVSGLGLLAPFWWVAIRRGPRYLVHYLGGLVLLQVAFIVLVGADVLRFDRFTVPIHALLIAIALVGAARWSARRPIVPRLFLLAAVVALALNSVRVQRALDKTCIHDWMHARVHGALGEVLAEALPPDTWIVFNEVGALPYRASLPTIDMIGLTDPVTAEFVRRSYVDFGTSDTDWCGEQIAGYVFSRQPDCIILPSYRAIDFGADRAPADAFYAIWRQVYLHPEFKSGFKPLLSVRVHEHKYFSVFVREGLELNRLHLSPLERADCAEVVYPPPRTGN